MNLKPLKISALNLTMGNARKDSSEQPLSFVYSRGREAMAFEAKKCSLCMTNKLLHDDPFLDKEHHSLR